MICFCVKSLTVKVQNCSSILLRPFPRPNASAHQKIIIYCAVSREYFYKFYFAEIRNIVFVLLWLARFLDIY